LGNAILNYLGIFIRKLTFVCVEHAYAHQTIDDVRCCDESVWNFVIVFLTLPILYH